MILKSEKKLKENNIQPNQSLRTDIIYDNINVISINVLSFIFALSVNQFSMKLFNNIQNRENPEPFPLPEFLYSLILFIALISFTIFIGIKLNL